MMRFMIGLLLGLLLGIAGTAAFLVTAGGADYFIATSPRVRELEAALKHSSQESEYLKKRLSEDSDMITRLESRFTALAQRFEALGGPAGANGAHASGTGGVTREGSTRSALTTAEPEERPSATPRPTPRAMSLGAETAAPRPSPSATAVRAEPAAASPGAPPAAAGVPAARR